MSDRVEGIGPKRLRTHEVCVVRDASGHVLEVRRLDGQTFGENGELGERKSHALKGSLEAIEAAASLAGG